MHGAETIFVELLSFVSSQKEKYNVHVVWNSTNRNETFSKKVTEFPVKTITEMPFKWLGGSNFRNIAILIYNLRIYLKIISLIKSQKIDIVYSNTSVNIIGLIASILTGKKHIWHFHEPVNATYGWTKACAKFYRILLKYKKNTTVFISEHQKKDWESNLKISFEKYKVIFNPVKTIEKTDKMSELSETIVFGFMGSFEKRKNISLLIKVFSRLANEFPDRQMKLQLTGNGEEKGNLKKEINKLNSQKIEVSDHSSDVTSFYSNIDVFILPSLSESWGLVALEALSVEKALILTSNTGLRELLKDNTDCIFIDPHSEDDLYQAMKKVLLDEQHRKQLAKNGYDKIRKIDFNNQFIAEFNNLLESNK
ncbi:MAG: glycosyltransferase family 4 protein [Prevotellaceae bacterium]|nr:glycosyltransferase family 4 protein [Prevotellaceae bacterium]